MTDELKMLCLAAIALLLLMPSQPFASARSEPAASVATQESGHGGPVGYDDTPMIPGQRWRVHDRTRPVPPVVDPGSASTASRPGEPPSDALVLFDGRDLSKWITAGKRDEQGKPVPARWKIENGSMEVNKTGSISTVNSFGDCQLHIEFALPAEVKGASQGRGNSGVFLMGRYEVQILDSYENRTYADGQAGALYGQYPPLANAARKPGAWQSYDIIFEAPRFEDGKLVKPAYITVIHNGVLIHHRTKLLGATAHKRVAVYSPHAQRGPIMLQDHGNPIRFRNIWIRELKGYDRK